MMVINHNIEAKNKMRDKSQNTNVWLITKQNVINIYKFQRDDISGEWRISRSEKLTCM